MLFWDHHFQKMPQSWPNALSGLCCSSSLRKEMMEKTQQKAKPSPKAL